MDDMTAFERQISDELRREIGPVPRFDAMAIARSATTTSPTDRWTVITRPLRGDITSASTEGGFDMFSAVKFVAAAAIVALFGGFLLAGVLTTPQDGEPLPAAVTESPSPTTAEESLAGMVTREVEPGVLRVIRDGAGHDLDETHPTYRYEMDGIAIAPDGTVWLLTYYQDTDNEANRGSVRVWALGQPGVFGLGQGVPLNWGNLVMEADGTPLVISDRVVRFDGEAFVPDDGPMFRPLVGDNGLWLIEPADLMGLVPDGESAVRPRGILPAIWYGSEWGALPEMGLEVETLEHFCETFGVGVDCYGEDETTYLAGTNIYRLAAAPDGSIWAVGEYDGGGGGLYRITPEPPAE